LIKLQQYSEKFRNLLLQYNNRLKVELDSENVESIIVGLMAFSQEMVEAEDKASLTI